MKCGTTALIFTFLYLRELRKELHGRLTLSVVSVDADRSDPIMQIPLQRSGP
jgi:hypothetical protein